MQWGYGLNMLVLHEMYRYTRFCYLVGVLWKCYFLDVLRSDYRSVVEVLRSKFDVEALEWLTNTIHWKQIQQRFRQIYKVFERFMIIMGRDVTSCKSCNNIFNYVGDNTISQWPTKMTTITIRINAIRTTMNTTDIKTKPHIQ